MNPIQPKVKAAGISGVALAPVIVWLASFGGIDMPAEVAASLGGLIAAVAGWMKA